MMGHSAANPGAHEDGDFFGIPDGDPVVFLGEVKGNKYPSHVNFFPAFFQPTLTWLFWMSDTVMLANEKVP